MDKPAYASRDTGRQEAALKMQELLLELRRKVLGPEHPDTLRVMHDLAQSYDDAGRQEEALKMQEQLLELRA